MSRPALDDPALRAWRDQTLYRLLWRASRAERTTVLERIHGMGFDDVSLADTNLMANLDMSGATISGLSRRAGISRQAASQQVAALERLGYLERRASESDARTVLVSRTERGRDLLDSALDLVDQLETDVATQLGPRRLATLKSLLTDLVAVVDPEGGLGPS